MTVRIEAGKIKHYQDSKKFMRWVQILDGDTSLFSSAVFADTKEELEIIDHENFRKEQ